MTILLKIDRDVDLAPTVITLVGMTALELAALWGANHIALTEETDPLEVERLSRGLAAIRQAIERRPLDRVLPNQPCPDRKPPPAC